jgi:hypothetical protein
MKERRFKVHYARDRVDFGICGLDGLVTYSPNAMTCRICMFSYLVSQAPWARGFLDELRGRVGRGQPAAVIIPATAAEPMDGKVEGTGHRQAGPFGQQRVTQEAIREIFTKQPAWGGPVQPVMDDGGAPAESIGVQPRQVPQRPGDAGQVSYEPGRYDKAD